jgi:hypothetical protein
MSDTNGSPVTRAELAAHIKGIDQQLQGCRPDDITEIKFGIHGISEAMRRAGADSFLGGRGRKLIDGVVVASIAAVVAVAVTFIH